MTDPADARLAYALLWLRRRAINQAMDKVKKAIDQEPGDRNAAKLGQARLGKVGMTEPEVKPMVVDAEDFVRYVQEVRPEEIEPSVRPAFQKALFDHFAKTGTLQDWDGNRVPGVGFGSEASKQVFFPEKDADDLVAVADEGDLPVIEDVDLAAVLGLRGSVGTPPGEATP